MIRDSGTFSCGILISNNIQLLSLEGCTHADSWAAVPTYGMANYIGCVGR